MCRERDRERWNESRVQYQRREQQQQGCLKDTEGLLSSLGLDSRLMRDNVEANGLAERTALSHSHDITVLDGKSRRAVHGKVLVPLLEPTVFLDVVQVVSPDNNGPLHFGRNDQTLEDPSTDGNISREGALLIDVVALNGGDGRLDAETDRFGEPDGLLADFGVRGPLASDKDSVLALVGTLVLVALDVISLDVGHC